MAYKFTQEQIKILKDQFNKFDKNQDNAISTKQLKRIINSLGEYPTQQQLNDLIYQIDIDQSGTIDFQEFKSLIAKKMKNNDQSEFKQAFDEFDVNKDGFISASDLKLALQEIYCKDGEEKFTSQQIDEMLQGVDIDKDSKINFKQFLAVLMAI